MTLTRRSYSVARFRFTKPILRPETSSQTRTRSPIGRMGVSDCTSSSLSIFLRLRLSKMVTSWPRSDRYSDVGQPQNPSPPRTRTRIPTPVYVALVRGSPAALAARPGSQSDYLKSDHGVPVRRYSTRPLACHDLISPTRPVRLYLVQPVEYLPRGQFGGPLVVMRHLITSQDLASFSGSASAEECCWV